MLADIHDALQRLLYEHGRISPFEVDVRFEAPTKEWVERLTRPTLNLFLFELQENTDLRQTSFQTTRGNGRAERRLPPRRVDLRYMVTAITTEIDDEHRLLWRALVTLLRHQQLPVDLLPEALRGIEPPLTTRVAQPDDGPRLLDIWGALSAEPRPALGYVVTAPLDLDIAIEAPLVLTRTARYLRAGADHAPEVHTHIGGTVRGKEGAPLAGVTVALEGSAADGSVTNGDGWFVLPGVPTGKVALRVARPDGPPKTVTIEVPAESYEIVLA